MLRPTSAMTLEKFGYMLETPPYLTLLEESSDNALSDADNQQGSRPTNVVGLTPQRLHAELLAATIPVSRAYLLGALHDATLSALHRTVRFGQSDVAWLEGVRLLFEKLGQRSWVYREGHERRLWILETSCRWLTECDELVTDELVTVEEQLAYTRGYCDTEGGVPHDPSSRFYVQFVQKSRSDIEALRQMLCLLGIRCGKLHNPSARIDDKLWRFYVLAESQREFAERVSSWHPRKRLRLEQWLTGRMKI